MTVLLVGDTHGALDMGKLMPRSFDYNNLTKNDYVIILGDFGVVFSNGSTGSWTYRHENYWLDWLDSRPWTTLFIDGNHENHPRLANDFPQKTWNGGQVHELRPSVLHLMRGEIFTLDGLKFLAMGGAASIDKNRRTPGVSWWEEEVPNDAEMDNCIRNLEANDWSVDYILTHDCPVNIAQEIGVRYNMDMKGDSFENWLQYIAENTNFTRWFFGHYHLDIPSIGEDGKFTGLIDQIYDAPEDNWSLRKLDVCDMLPSDIPPSKNNLGYSPDEVLAIAGCSAEDYKRALSCEMYGSAMGYDEKAGVPLLYFSDMVDRVLPLITNVDTRRWK